ncbi:NAD(P)/FAD-dependent oxidoreductase [Pusillimonas sp.]|uniref:NAD(P)/FAD-dependent oxidoreductase n=1 Tax=Pusillimonas sp. TaxID=3040095 RepID=UPI0037C9AABC
MENHIIIIGAGQAGLQAAEALRAEKYEGRITLLGDEPDAPYHRPPLSKAALKEGFAPEQLVMRGQAVFDRKQIQLRTGSRVSAIDPGSRTVTLSNGEALQYSGLILATGATPRRLPGSQDDSDAVHVLRSRQHSAAIAQRLGYCRERQLPVVVIGGGFIGLEVAAVARDMGLEVTVLEAGPNLVGRVATPALASFYERRHRERGVHIELGAQVAKIETDGSDEAAIHLSDGKRLQAGLALVAIGIVPNDQLAKAAGLECEHGIVVDALGRSSAPGIVAAGDCTARRCDDGTLLRLESVQNAIEQGKAAARTLLGQERPFEDVPYFWSDQYDLKLQIAGVARGVTASVVRAGSSDNAFSIYHFADDRLVSVDTINSAKEHLTARKLLKAGVSPSIEQVQDPGCDLAVLLIEHAAQH